MISKEEYLKNPCRSSSLNYWKSNAISVPSEMSVIHDSDYDADDWNGYADECYFRLLHRLDDLQLSRIPRGYRIHNFDSRQIAKHINLCYSGYQMGADEVESWKKRNVYDPTLWLTICDEVSGEIVASGIAEIDPEIAEGSLEWIQVSPAHRRHGLGRYVVLELLNRMKPKACFATVSGKLNDVNSPLSLYRSCGFTGNDVWHVLSRLK